MMSYPEESTHNGKRIIVKCSKKYFTSIWFGWKRFEIRKDDRFYEENDIILLKEWEKNAFSGRELKCRILELIRDFEGLKEGYVVFTISVMECQDPSRNLFFKYIRKLKEKERLEKEKTESWEKENGKIKLGN